MDAKQESFWPQYFKTLNRHKIVAAATFALIVGSFGVAALQTPPPPDYYAEGVLVDNEPLVSVSDTSLQVSEEGKGIINEDLLLSDILLSEASQQLREKGISLTPEQLIEKTKISIVSAGLNNQTGPKTDRPSPSASKVTIRVLGNNAEVAETTLTLMMEAMVELSEITNKARLESILKELTARVSEIESSIQEDTAALQVTENSTSQAVIEKQIERQEAALDEVSTLQADAALAKPEIVSSLAIARLPFVVINDPDEPSALFVMTSGVSTALLIVGWLIFGLNSRQKNTPIPNGLAKHEGTPPAKKQPIQF